MSIGASSGMTQGSYSAMSNFPTGFQNGVSIQGTPITMTNPGRVFWVDSVNGSNSNRGTFARPFATVAGALTAMASGNGAGINSDIIYVKDGHVETITAATTWSQAGVSIIGLGNARKKPTLTFTTATSAKITLGAANMRLSGFRLVNGIASLVTMLSFGAKDIMVDGNEFYEGAATTGLTFIDLTGITANACDRLKIYGNSFLNPTSGNYTAAIKLTTVQDQVDIQNNFIRGNFSSSGIHNITGKVMTNLSLGGNIVYNLTTGASASQMISASTGQYWGNKFFAADQTAAGFVPGTSMVSMGGNFDQLGNMEAGETFVVTKSIVSSTLTTSAQTLLTATNGAVDTINVIARTDGTGLAGATNFRILSNNANGLAAILENAVSGLGANKTVDLTSAGVVKQATTIEAGKIVQFLGTSSSGTGAGVVYITIEGRRVVAAAGLWG